MDRYRERRSPDRSRDRYLPTTQIDSYVPSSSSRASRPRSRSPGGFRARSRTPPRTADSYRGRPASPSGRHDSRIDSYSPRDARPRSPRREPVRDRSPQGQKRAREPSPLSRGNRSPQNPAKRERGTLPPMESSSGDSYRPRSRSPPARREDRANSQTAKAWRQSQSPRVDSGRNSGATSRRSSPPPLQVRRPTDSVAMDDARSATSYRSPRNRTPPAHRDSPYRHDSETYDSRSKMSSEHEQTINGTRQLPVGPSGSYHDAQSTNMAVPTGPSASSLSATSAYSRHGPPTAPAYARGTHGGFRGRGGPASSRDYSLPSRGQPNWGSPPPYGRGAIATGGAATSPSAASAHDHRGPLSRRGSSYSASGPSHRGSGNSTSLTTPRTQRFHQAMSGVSEMKPGGEKLPSLHDTGKADRLEEEAARLRKLIDDKEMKKRQGLKEWDKLERESANAALRSELAEEHLRSLNGEGESMAAAF